MITQQLISQSYAAFLLTLKVGNFTTLLEALQSMNCEEEFNKISKYFLNKKNKLNLEIINKDVYNLIHILEIDIKKGIDLITIIRAYDLFEFNLQDKTLSLKYINSEV